MTGASRHSIISRWTGKLIERVDEGDWSTFWFELPRELSRQMASKGSITIDGVSLTIVESLPERFSVALIPYTLDVTTLGSLSDATWITWVNAFLFELFAAGS